MIFNILDNTTELWMTKYIIGEIFSSGGATLYRNPSDQTVDTRQVVDRRTLAPSNVLCYFSPQNCLMFQYLQKHFSHVCTTLIAGSLEMPKKREDYIFCEWAASRNRLSVAQSILFLRRPLNSRYLCSCSTYLVQSYLGI